MSQLCITSACVAPNLGRGEIVLRRFSETAPLIERPLQCRSLAPGFTASSNNPRVRAAPCRRPFWLSTSSHLTIPQLTAMLSTSMNNSFAGFPNLDERHTMNRRDLLKSLPMLAAFGSASSVLAADTLPKGSARLRTAICAYSFRDALKKKSMTYDDLVRLAVELDVDGLDLTVYWFPNTSDDFLLPLRRLAYKNGVEIYSISIRSDMCRPTEELRDRESAWLERWMEVAAKLGAGHIRVFGGDVPKGSTEDQAAEWVVSILKRAAEYSGRKGVILGLENHGGITSKAERVVQIVKAVNSPWVGINLDTGNFRSDTYAQIEACVPYAVNVQFKTEISENGKKLPSDWNRILRRFPRAGTRATWRSNTKRTRLLKWLCPALRSS